MDGNERHHGKQDGYRHRGGRSGSLSRKHSNSSATYRRVQAISVDDHEPDTMKRTVQLQRQHSDAATPSTQPFKSSLMESILKDAQEEAQRNARRGQSPKRSVTRDDGGGRGGRGRGGSPKRRDRSHSPRRNDDSYGGVINNGRKVTMTKQLSPPPSPVRRFQRVESTGSEERGRGKGNVASKQDNGRQEREPPRSTLKSSLMGSIYSDREQEHKRPAFKSSLLSSISSEKEKTSPEFKSSLMSSISNQDVRFSGRGNGGKVRGSSTDTRTQAGSMGGIEVSRTDDVESNRKVELSVTEDTANSPNGKISQGNYESSVLPMKSSLRRVIDRKNSTDSVSSHRSERDRRQRWEPKGRPNDNRKSSIESDHGESNGQGDRPAFSRLERSISDSARSEPPPAPFRSSLAVAAGIKSSQDSNAQRPQDTRHGTSDKGSTSSLRESLDERNSSRIRPSDSPGSHQSAGTTSSTSTNPSTAASDEERRKLAAERLRARFEARNLERASSLGDTSSRTADKTSEKEPLRDTSAPSRDQEARTREYYERMKKEDEEREAKRRSVPFTSSLLLSIGSGEKVPDQQHIARKQMPFESTLQKSIASSGGIRRQTPLQSSVRSSLGFSARSIAAKVVYTLEQLRSLKARAIPRPSDLRDLSIVAEEVVRVPGRKVETLGRSSTRADRDMLVTKGSTRRGGKVSKQPPPQKGDRRGGRRGGDYKKPPPPPLYDGPIEPLQVSENRWVAKKKEELPALQATLSHVKGLLNKLTREKFAKITAELCKIEMDSLEMLRLIISVVMDKALEEPNFADVYADLCKEFHTRTVSKVWRFLRSAESIQKQGVFYWTVSRANDPSEFAGPFSSYKECFADAAAENRMKPSKRCDPALANLFKTEDSLLEVVELGRESFFYRKKLLSELTEDEPVLGEFDSSAIAIQAGAKQISWKRLLVTRCQFEFERLNKRFEGPSESDQLDPRQREINATREKRLMLGNIRFIGELFKADLLNQVVVQTCIFYLLGLELVQGSTDTEMAGRELRLPGEEDIEALCKLLATVGKKYDQPKTQPIMKIIILRLVQLSEEKMLPSRARFLVKDVLEMRDHRWEPRRQELQQKTLEEVRREAKQLQQQGKNAQHDNLNSRRLKSQVSSVQLAKQSSNLLVRKESSKENISSPPPSGGMPPSVEVEGDPSKIESRIKNIIQEYGSIHDVAEAATCVRELPARYHAQFAEQIVNRALEGKDSEREDVVTLLVSLYEVGAIDATSIQTALMSVMEFLEDIRIDIPLVHEYSALLLGRLIAAGCFGLVWLVSDALGHLVECGLASLIFAEVLSAIEDDSDEATVVQMISDQEINPTSVLPAAIRTNDAEVSKYLSTYRLDVYFGADHDDEDDDQDDDEEEELDPETEGKMRSTLKEYLAVKDVNEVAACVNELSAATSDPWRHFARVCAFFSIDAKQSVRVEVAELLSQLLERDELCLDDLESAFEASLSEYEDLRVDIPMIADSFADLWAPLFHDGDGLTIDWLHEGTSHLAELGYRAELLSALLSRFEVVYGRDELVSWWNNQEDSDKWFAVFSASDGEVHQRLLPWKESLSR